MENQTAMEQQSYEDVRKSGYLRKQKSMHRRFFVLRAASEQGLARLEYYENEKKFRSKSPVPKKAVNLDSCFNINKRADSKNKHMIVLYTRGESFAIAADTEEVQNEWYQAMLDLQCKCKTPDECGSGGDCELPSPGPAFKEVWQVKVWPKGLGQARNLVGIYRLCLTDKTVNFVKLNCDVAAVVLQLMNVRRCGHSENFFFIEVGRSAMTGPGEFWMQVEDSVVAQNMHETLLEAMKALSEEFRQRSKSQTVGVNCGGGTASNPISVPSRRHHPNLPPSQVGFSRRARTETPGVSNSNTSPTPRHGFSRSRTASIGARTDDGGGRATALSTSPSLNGSSCSTTPTLRPKPTRAPTPAKITLSLARYTPNPAPSPAPSLSSSSGHGSECGLGGAAFGTVPICTYARIPQRVSMSGSPSDYGSSDEYGSSPGEHSLLAAGLPAALVEGGASYILMGHREGSHKRVHGRRVLRRSSSRECKAERRLLSKRASLPPTSTQERLVPRRREEEEEDEEDYAVMSRSASRESFTSRRGSGGSATTSLVQEISADKGVSTKGGPEDSSIDSGYMSMLPGVTAPPASLSLSVTGSDVVPKGGDEYMAMTPNSSVSPPQHIRLPINEGYMMMSPNSSCSPDLHGLSGCIWGSRGSMESRAGSDYMNMSPISARSACSTPPSHPEQKPLQPKMVYSYFSLPRSYKHTALSTRGGRQLSLSSSSFSSSSASSESLEDRVGGAHPKVSAQHHHQQRCGPGVQKQGHLQSRKSSTFYVDVSKANTLPRVRETLLPTASQSPGEYVSIVYQGDFSAPLSTSISLSSEYVNMDLGNSPSSLTTLSSFKPAPKVREEISRAPQVEQEVEMGLRKSSMTGLTSTDVAAATFTDYTEMKFGLVADTTSKSPKAGQTPLPSSIEQEHNMNFPSPKAFSNIDQGARLVRAESTARRRHRSETFITPPTHPLSPSASPCPFSETPHVGPTRQQGLESNLWSNNQPSSPQCASPGVANLPAAQASSLTLEQGLNYIDLDLVSKENQTSVDGPCGPHSFFSPVVGGLTGGLGGAGGNTSSSINTYASIDFIKSDELRVHQSSRKDSKGKNIVLLLNFIYCITEAQFRCLLLHTVSICLFKVLISGVFPS
uniref:Insulin receptor substrate 1-B-like n=1 Tax=Sinocyclocheilus rhinocerous TaxID=307959 RepID=A0A673G043_9TELE